MTEEVIKAFSSDLIARGYCAPTGKRWQEFFDRIRCYSTESRPPAPLILAASGEPPSRKHLRLIEQLRWSASCHRIDDALQFLKELDHTDWEVVEGDQWSKQRYWSEPG